MVARSKWFLWSVWLLQVHVIIAVLVLFDAKLEDWFLTYIILCGMDMPYDFLHILTTIGDFLFLVGGEIIIPIDQT